MTALLSDLEDAEEGAVLRGKWDEAREIAGQRIALKAEIARNADELARPWLKNGRPRRRWVVGPEGRRIPR